MGTRALERSQLAAEPQTVEALQAKRNDKYIVVSFGSMKQRCIGIRFGFAAMLAGQHRGDLAGRGRAVVHDHDVTVAARVGRHFPVQQLHSRDVERPHAQLIGELLEARKRAHTRDQGQFRNRLCQKIISIGLKTLHPIRLLVERSDNEHRNVMRRRRRFQAPAHLKTAQARHHYVEQHHIAFAALAEGERLVPIDGIDDIEIFRRQPHFQKPQVGRHIVDHEHTGAHALPLRPIREIAEWCR
jgi:hypothetical protein